MVRESRRSRRPRKVMGSHQRCWIWGRHVVLETLRAGRWPILELVLSDKLSANEIARTSQIAAERDVRVALGPPEDLTRLCRAGDHQGYAAKMPPFPYEDAFALVERGPERPLYVVLDAVQDPHNFGAIVRSAEIFGANAVLVGSDRQSEVTSVAARSSAGAVNFMALGRADDLPELVRRIRARGVQTIGASEKSEQPIYACDLREGTALVIGNEGAGIRPELLELCDELASIPQQGHVGSLNAAVSAGVILYEASRQRMGI